ncbi:50S ribosomal protein L18 [Buchnera aphidicola]|uniref:Large ribosomal subunit protein uL18 n=1 Tax=Buchnera aphidicola (Stegophylla sp.) TaxID=2315800 RepID=A0A4D6YKV9_9GAMM|nr:50S ribosomal protein L18 [Buchnera aphidicola (Stegophylla sp.)]QCI26550.1 50S ribosomal protein L18 [Buchnera aphidicola (Stegophylla sp.)]
MNKKSVRFRRLKKCRMHLKKLNKFRLVVHRTSRHIYAQIIDSKTDGVCTVASTLEKKIKENLNYTGNKLAASVVGSIIAQRAISKGINVVSFDRSGFKYHGRIKTLAESARKSGLNF